LFLNYGYTVNPLNHRLGVVYGWSSIWYTESRCYVFGVMNAYSISVSGRYLLKKRYYKYKGFIPLGLSIGIVPSRNHAYLDFFVYYGYWEETLWLHYRRYWRYRKKRKLRGYSGWLTIRESKGLFTHKIASIGYLTYRWRLSRKVIWSFYSRSKCDYKNVVKYPQKLLKSIWRQRKKFVYILSAFRERLSYLNKMYRLKKKRYRSNYLLLLKKKIIKLKQLYKTFFTIYFKNSFKYLVRKGYSKRGWRVFRKRGFFLKPKFKRFVRVKRKGRWVDEPRGNYIRISLLNRDVSKLYKVKNFNLKRGRWYNVIFMDLNSYLYRNGWYTMRKNINIMRKIMTRTVWYVRTLIRNLLLKSIMRRKLKYHYHFSYVSICNDVKMLGYSSCVFRCVFADADSVSSNLVSTYIWVRMVDGYILPRVMRPINKELRRYIFNRKHPLRGYKFRCRGRLRRRGRAQNYKWGFGSMPLCSFSELISYSSKTVILRNSIVCLHVWLHKDLHQRYQGRRRKKARGNRSFCYSKIYPWRLNDMFYRENLLEKLILENFIFLYKEKKYIV